MPCLEEFDFPFPDCFKLEPIAHRLPAPMSAPHPARKRAKTQTGLAVDVTAPQNLERAHRFAPNTRKAYDQQLAAARKWLVDQVTKLPASSSDTTIVLNGLEAHNPFRQPNAASAFTTPQPCTPDLIVQYLAYKCETEGCKVSTAETVRASFKQAFGKMCDAFARVIRQYV